MTKVIDEYFKKVCTRDDIVSPMYYLSVLCITQSVWNTGYDCMLGYVYCEYLEFVLFIVLFVLFVLNVPHALYIFYFVLVIVLFTCILYCVLWVLYCLHCNMYYVLHHVIWTMITVSMHMYAMMPRHTDIKVEHYFLQYALQLLL